MKRTRSVLLLFTILFLCACGEKTVMAADASLEDISLELQEQFAAEQVTALNGDYMLLLYGLEPQSYTEAAAFRVKRLAFPDECILLKARDEESRTALLERLNNYRSSVLEQSRSYEPETHAVMEKCGAESEGLYVWMFLSSRNQELNAALRAHLRDYPLGEAPIFTPAPTPAPTPEPTSEPTAEPTPEPVAEEVPEAVNEPESLPWGLVGESERAENSWFHDSILVGTSVSNNLRDYVLAMRMWTDPDCLDNMVFFTASDFSYHYALGSVDGLFPMLQGEWLSVEDAVARTHAQKVYLNLGYCDLVLEPWVDVNKIVGDMEELVRRIREKSPEVTVIILSVTPRLSDFDTSHYGAPRIRELNSALLAWTETHEAYYIDCYTPLANEDGGLNMAYHLSYGPEDGAHLNNDGARIWLDTLYTHTIP